MSAPPSRPPGRRRLFVTTALPYANGPFHIGHIMEYIQADIWVRFQRMQGHEVHFVCADDAHGAPIMLKAEAEGITPQALVARIAAERPRYLEGFHIPFVHAGLNAVVDYASYATELFRFASVQVALAAPGEPAFAPPPDSPERGRRVAAYYWWIFPNLMLNFYPWGLSVNLVQPEGPDRTRIAFRSYVGDAALLAAGAGAALDRVEQEDEAIVHAVQRGVRARLYRGGRYSPTRERGVHHFHRLLTEFL